MEPKFSPKGNNIVFRRLTGGYLLSPEWSLEPGIYLADRKAKTMEKVTEDGFNAHFAADEDRLYFTSYAPESKYTELELYSVDLKGRDERTLLKGDKVTEYQLSPDGKWIGYTHQNNAFVAPFLSTGLQQELDIEDSGLPVAQVSKRAGEYLSWSAGSDRLSWSHGATVFSRELNQAFSFLAGAPDELPEPVSEGLNLGFSQIADKPSSTIALVGGQVVTMRDADNAQEVISNGVVVVQDNRIVAVSYTHLTLPTIYSV